MNSDTITSPQNQRVKDAARLRERRHRDKRGRFLIDGARELSRAIAAGVPLVELFVCEPLCQTAECRSVVEMATAARAAVLRVAPPVFAKLAFGQRTDGVLGVARVWHRALVDIRLPERPLVAVIEGVEKPGNVGAVLRSADAAGVSAVVLADGVTDVFNPNCIRASLGTVFTLPVAEASTAETIAWLRQHNVRIYAARVDAQVMYADADYSGPTALILGSESQGLSDAWRAAGVTPIRIPMRGVADSLNVSATAAVLFYEALRQRGLASD